VFSVRVQGFEPQLEEPKSSVLPLDDTRIRRFACNRRGRRCFKHTFAFWQSLFLDIEIFYVERVFFDELPAGFDLVAHQDGEQFIGLYGIVNANP
jgi:hypothetical protein